MSYQDFGGSTPESPDNPVDPYQTQYGSQEQYGVSPYAAGPSYGSYQGAAPPDYRAWVTAAIIGGVLFSLIIGMPMALVARAQSRRVRSMSAQGDMQGAAKASRSARIWLILATVVEALGLIYVALVLSRG